MKSAHPFLFLFIAACVDPCTGGDVTLGFPFEVVGEVVKPPTTRYQRGLDGQGGTEKVALTLRTNTAALPENMADAISGNEIVVECLSTRCTQIAVGETHALGCKTAGRLFEPNVVVCKHVRQVTP